MKNLEEKTIVGSLKDLDLTKRVATGYLSGIGNKDHVGDIITKGAFVKSINERMDKIFFLNQHKWDQPHGKFKVLEEQAKNLYFESQPLPDTSYSNDLLKLYDAGIVTKHSIGFVTIKDEFSKEDDARIIKEVKLYEGSNVTMPANDNTDFLGLKTDNPKESANQIKRIMKMLRSGDVTDDTMTLLEIALKQYEAYLIKLAEKVAAEPSTKDTPQEPSDDTHVIEALELFNKNLKV